MNNPHLQLKLNEPLKLHVLLFYRLLNGTGLYDKINQWSTNFTCICWYIYSSTVTVQ